MLILRAFLGLAFFCGVAWMMSSHKSRVNLRLVIAGIGLQLALGFVIIEGEEVVQPGDDGQAWTETLEDGSEREHLADPDKAAAWEEEQAHKGPLERVSDVVVKLLSFGEDGAEMVFGPLTGFYHEPAWDEGAGDPRPELAIYSDFPIHLAGEPAPARTDIISLGLKGLTTIIYFSALMAILYYLGVMQRIIWVFAKVMTKLLGVSGAESLAMSANVFVGQTEAPLVVKPYVKSMTKSELMALMTGGFATIAGSVLAVYIGILGKEFAGHLLAASFMSAPAAFVLAKIMVPETEVSTTAGVVNMAKVKDPDGPTNLIDAAARGIGDGLTLFLNVLAMLIGFVAIVALVNYFLSFMSFGADPVTGEVIPVTLEGIFGYTFAPVAWLMGVDGWSECKSFGTLLGIKIGVNEFVAFGDLARMQSEGALNPRHAKMAAYALCGFANFASIGIQLGGISPLAPERRGQIAKFALKAMLGGAFASWMTATIAGMFL
jgi:concentrative nucleoside transporter, CNT family